MVRRLANCASGNKHALIFFVTQSANRYSFFVVNDLENVFITKVKGIFKSEAKAWQFLEILNVKLAIPC